MEEQVKQDASREYVEGGAFVNSVDRKNSKIKSDRAKAIGEDAEIRFKRDVEDIGLKIRKLERVRENMLDLSGDNAFSTMPTAEDFDDEQFSKDYRAIGVQLRNLNIEFALAKEDFKFLFDKDFV